MKKIGPRLAWLAVGASALALAACGGGGGGGVSTGTPSAPPPAPTPPPPPTATSYAVTNLVSDQAGVALTQDANLVDAWGIVFAPGAPVWVANNGTNTSTLYDGNGANQGLVVTLPPGTATANIAGGTDNPTGVVFNGATSAFMVTEGGKTGSASFIFDGEEGVISGWSQQVDSVKAIKVVDNSAKGAVYKGLAIYAPASGPSLLFAANFHAGTVDVFDSNFKPTTVANGFSDPNLPAGYAPFGIQVINNMVYVAYAEQDTKDAPSAFNEVDGAGLGFVDEFDATGKFVKRFDNPGGNLDAPWGIAIAPSGFGSLSGDLLVGNFGDGTISAYDPNTGAFVGKLTSNGSPVVLPGLWGIGFGNGSFNQPTTTLFFASGPNSETHGLYGRIDLPGTYTAPGSPPPPAPPPPPPAPPGY